MENTQRVDKLYLTNQAALEAKYGGSGVAKIEQQLAALVTADAQRGLTAQIGFLDQPEGVLPRVTQPDDDKTTKDAFDAWFSTTAPDYVVIVGGSDVVCFQPLANPLHIPGHIESDPDTTVPSDLPYACAASHDLNIGRCVTPSRVIGRLPDYPEEADLDMFLSVLDSASVHTTLDPPDDANSLLVSAERWKAAADTFVSAALGRVPTVRTSPSEGPLWTHAELARRWHLFSCHGASATPVFYGEDLYGTMPESHRATHLAGKIAAGTVCVTGCCYGAQLYPPSFAAGVPGICFSYLSQQAGGYVGSTNIAYGRDDIPFGCDEFSGYVLAQLANGSSTGRALLGARLSYLAAHHQLSPIEQKTLAQFVLYGDPSVHPLNPPAGLSGSGVEDRRARREAIAARANTLARYIAAAEPASLESTTARSVGRGVRVAASLAAEVGLQGARIARFAVPQRPTAPIPTTRTGRPAVTTPSPFRAYYVVLGRAADMSGPAGVTSLIGVEVAERADGTIEQRIFRSRGGQGKADGVILRPGQESSNRGRFP